MSYCKNCGAELQNEARFCASCGTPAGSMPPMNGGVPYPGIPVQGNAGAWSGNAGMPPNANGQGYGSVQASNANGQAYGSVQASNANGQAYGNAEAPYANGQAYGSVQASNANGQAYGSVQASNANGQAYGNAEAPYANGQVYGNAEAPYVNGQAYGGGYPDAGMYGAAVQPQSNRKALAVIGTIVGLAVMIAVILLIVLLTRDNSHRTYEQAVGVFMNGLKRQDMGKMLEAFPERIQEEFQRDMLRFYDSEDAFWEEYNEDLEWYCGRNVKTTYDIVSAEPLLHYQIEDYEKDCLEDFHYDVSITDGYAVEIEVTFKGSEGEFSSELELDVVRIDGKWYVIGY